MTLPHVTLHVGHCLNPTNPVLSFCDVDIRLNTYNTGLNFFWPGVKVIKKVWAEQTAGQYTIADVCYTCKLNKNRTRTLLLLKLSIVICPASRVPKGRGCPLSVRLLLPNSKWVGGNCTLAFCLGSWLAGGVMVFLDHFVL